MHKLVRVVSEICFSDKKIQMLFKDWSVSETTIYETRYVLGNLSERYMQSYQYETKIAHSQCICYKEI